MEVLRIEGVRKTFGSIQILRDIRLMVEAGEHVAIIGPNGAGKTTLLNVLSGELPSDAGCIKIFGKDVTSKPTYQRVQIGLARSFQVSRVFANLTILQNILLAIQGIRYSRFSMWRALTSYTYLIDEARKLLEAVNMWDKKDEMADTMSHGERRKLEIAISLASKPKLLLLDEPSAGLDISEIQSFIKMINILAEGITLVFAAHDMDVVFGLATRVAVLYYGEFVADGTPEEIRVNPKVKEIYLGLQNGR